MTKLSTVIAGLKQTLAETYTLYLQTQNFHWNLTGKEFYPLHQLFEEQYSEYAEAIDLIAETLRTLDVKAPGTFAEFSQLSQIEMQADAKDSQTMLEILIAANKQLIQTLTELEKAADQADDLVVEDLAVERLRAHTKVVWMLESSLA